MNELTAAYRAQQVSLRAVTLRTLTALWPTLDIAELDATFPGWAQAVGLLVRQNRGAAIALASQYVRDSYALAGLGSSPTLVLASVMPDPVKLHRSLLSTALVDPKKATGRGVPLTIVKQNAFVTSSGAITRHVLDGGRATIVDSVKADPRGKGWQRVTSAGACDFCVMLADRGAVYREATAFFATHDHCGCSAVPVYGP